ncbi:hypothetical protein ACWDTG_06830 [Rhodococcus zopfii]
MTDTIPGELSLIRIWDKNFNDSDYLIEQFDHGFALPDDHPFASKLWDFDFLHVNITVLDTWQTHWKAVEVESDYENRSTRVRCEPWIEGLRKTIVSDAWFLAAERKRSQP